MSRLGYMLILKLHKMYYQLNNMSTLLQNKKELQSILLKQKLGKN